MSGLIPFVVSIMICLYTAVPAFLVFPRIACVHFANVLFQTDLTAPLFYIIFMQQPFKRQRMEFRAPDMALPVGKGGLSHRGHEWMLFPGGRVEMGDIQLPNHFRLRGDSNASAAGSRR